MRGAIPCTDAFLTRLTEPRMTADDRVIITNLDEFLRGETAFVMAPRWQLATLILRWTLFRLGCCACRCAAVR
jgi:hypothetical protein